MTKRLQTGEGQICGFSTSVESCVKNQQRVCRVFSVFDLWFVENRRIYSEYSQFQPSYQQFFVPIPLYTPYSFYYKLFFTFPHSSQFRRLKKNRHIFSVLKTYSRSFRNLTFPIPHFEHPLLLLLYLPIMWNWIRRGTNRESKPDAGWKGNRIWN